MQSKAREVERRISKTTTQRETVRAKKQESWRKKQDTRDGSVTPRYSVEFQEGLVIPMPGTGIEGSARKLSGGQGISSGGKSMSTGV